MHSWLWSSTTKSGSKSWAEEWTSHKILSASFNKKESPASGTSTHSCADTFSPLKPISSTYLQLYQRVTYTQLPHSGHEDKGLSLWMMQHARLKNVKWIHYLIMMIKWAVAALKKILIQALAWFFLHKSMTNTSKTVYIHVNMLTHNWIKAGQHWENVEIDNI